MEMAPGNGKPRTTVKAVCFLEENLKALIEAKRQGKTIVEEEAPKRAPVIDMMEALKRSLHETELQKRKKPMRARTGARKREGRQRLAS